MAPFHAFYPNPVVARDDVPPGKYQMSYINGSRNYISPEMFHEPYFVEYRNNNKESYLYCNYVRCASNSNFVCQHGIYIGFIKTKFYDEVKYIIGRYNYGMIQEVKYFIEEYGKIFLQQYLSFDEAGYQKWNYFSSRTLRRYMAFDKNQLSGPNWRLRGDFHRYIDVEQKDGFKYRSANMIKSKYDRFTYQQTSKFGFSNYGRGSLDPITILLSGTVDPQQRSVPIDQKSEEKSTDLVKQMLRDFEDDSYRYNIGGKITEFIPDVSTINNFYIITTGVITSYQLFTEYGNAEGPARYKINGYGNIDNYNIAMWFHNGEPLENGEEYYELYKRETTSIMYLPKELSLLVYQYVKYGEDYYTYLQEVLKILESLGKKSNIIRYMLRDK